MILIKKPMRATYLKVIFSKNSRGQNIKNKNKIIFSETSQLLKIV